MSSVSELVFQSDLLRYPGPWAFGLPRAWIILVSDAQLIALEDPDHKIDLSISAEPRLQSLREVCEQAQARGERTLIVAFDHFWAQYRPGQAGPRQLLPDTDEYIERIARISRFAEGYGLGLELSLLTPLEIGAAYRRATGESGVWMHYRKGVRGTESGRFSVELWRHRRWANNKGAFDIEDAGVRVFAFDERAIAGTPYRVVDPAGITEITGDIGVEVYADTAVDTGPGGLRLERIRVHGAGGPAGPGRILVVQHYRTPEMDYFSDQAAPFLTSLVDRYADAGVRLHALYSDEMHIQQDWHYGIHHDHGDFALRYVSPGLSRRFAAHYGEQFTDFARYLIYFCQGQEDFSAEIEPARGDIQHVWGDTPEAIAETALFRARYYRFLHDGVVKRFVDAKRHAEERMGHTLESRAHATWAESPTIDFYRRPAPDRRDPRNTAASMYDYTPDFVASNTVHQAAAACDDYFRWGDFLTGNGNDHAECGYLDRDYFGLALGCSLGILNDVPYAYAAHWGMPDAVARRRQALVNAYGANAEPHHALVQDMQHRDVDVLMLYPLDLTAASARFGTWMAQYGYANYITPAKLLERGTVADGAIEVAGRRFTTLVALFEPHPAPELLAMMAQLAKAGGTVVWSGPPPLLAADGSSTLTAWQSLFGVEFLAEPNLGRAMPGRVVEFSGPLTGIPAQSILTDFLVDHVYPVTLNGADAVAVVDGMTVGAYRRTENGGQTLFLGFRPRDDQSASLGYETRTWHAVFEALDAFPEVDHTERLSRTMEMLFCRFPNGTLAAAPHLRTMPETWHGGFHRDANRDADALRHNPPPDETLRLDGCRVAGRTVSYTGTGAVSFRLNAQGRLIAFAGQDCRDITVDGTTWTFAEDKLALLAFAPVLPERRVDPALVLQLRVDGAGPVRIPVGELAGPMRLLAEGLTPCSRGDEVPCTVAEGWLRFDAASVSGRWLFLLRDNPA